MKEGTLKLSKLTISLVAAAPLLVVGCPSDDTGGDAGAASSTGTPATDTGTTMAPTTMADTTVAAESSSSGDEPWPEFDCEGVDGVIDNNVTIESVADLAQLDGIREVTRTLLINDSDLVDLDALGCIEVVGETLQIFGNSQLANVDGLVNINTIGENLIFTMNPAVTNFSGLQQLEQLPGSMSMNSNDGLTEISGFDSFVGLEGNITIRDNPVLTNVDGLKGLQVVNGNLAITANPMLCISSVNCVGDGIVQPAVFPPEWSTNANDESC